MVTFVYITFSLWGFIVFNSMYVSHSHKINNLQKPARLSGSITVNARILLWIPSVLSALLRYFITVDQTISLHFQLDWFCFCGFLFMIILAIKRKLASFFTASKCSNIRTTQYNTLLFLLRPIFIIRVPFASKLIKESENIIIVKRCYVYCTVYW